MSFLITPRTVIESSGHYTGNPEKVNCIDDSSLPSEGYILEITPQKLQLTASSPAGFFYGRQAFDQWQATHHGALPAVSIHDQPDLSVRGFMLDISRGRVPTMERFYQLIDQLAALRYNQLQLYTEHTFAYRKHSTVWEHASPITHGEIATLQDYCTARHIELVPNQNSLGHMERWLCHPAYKHLAECPDGFIHPISGQHRASSTLKPNAESLQLLEELYDELLPLFSSPWFNVGLDEPWELGQGWSSERAQQNGKHRVYLDYLQAIDSQLQRHGKKMLFWADIILERPELISEIPSQSIPVLWGYEADHPFEEQSQILTKSGLNYLIAPGTSCWNSLSGRWSNAQKNIQSACQQGLTNKAQGTLLAHWGDEGYHQPTATLYPPLVYHAGQAWCPGSNSLSQLPAQIDLLLDDRTGKLGETLIQLGSAEKEPELQIFNRSFSHSCIFNATAQLAQQLEGISLKTLRNVELQYNQLHECVTSLREQASTVFHAEELNFALETIEWGLKRASEILSKPSLADCGSNGFPNLLEKRYSQLWLEQHRLGGLEESIRYFPKS